MIRPTLWGIGIPGRGVQGVIDGMLYQLGNHRLIEELRVCSPELGVRLDVLERQRRVIDPSPAYASSPQSSQTSSRSAFPYRQRDATIP